MNTKFSNQNIDKNTQRINRVGSNKTKQNNKRKKGPIVLILVFALVICSLIGGVILYNLILNTGSSEPGVVKPVDDDIPDTNNQKPPISFPRQVIDTSDDQPETQYVYAGLNRDGQVLVFTEDGEQTILEVEEADRSNLKWSPRGENISLLESISSEDTLLPNIQIYSITEQDWISETSYENFGVNSYVWFEPNVIYFNQGIGNGNWLHSWDISEVASIEKSERIDGNIMSISPDKTKILYKLQDGKFSVHSNSGEELWIMDSMFELDENDREVVVSPNNVIWGDDSNKLYFEGLGDENDTGNIFTYKTALNRDRVFKLDIDPVIPVCAIDTNKFIAYQEFEITNTLEFYEIDDELFTQKLVYSLDLTNRETIVPDSVRCISDKTPFFSTMRGNQQFWFRTEGNNLVELDFLQNLKEVAVHE